MTNKENIPLACLGIDRVLLSEVARILWCDVYWTDEREEEYRQTHGALWVQDITCRPETPDVPVLDVALFSLFYSVGRIEQAWGRSFWSVAAEMYSEVYADRGDNPERFRGKLEELVYRTIMACIGHGIDASDDCEGWPEELDLAPISIENPLQDQVE